MEYQDNMTKERWQRLRSMLGFTVCACGCGTEILPFDERGRKRIYTKGHHRGWGTGKINDRGYSRILQPSHPRADSKGYVLEQILVLEKSFRRAILSTEVIHHIDGNRSNNDLGNLMCFKTKAMHNAYHRRIRALEACGNYEWIKCHKCRKYDHPKHLKTIGTTSYHLVAGCRCGKEQEWLLKTYKETPVEQSKTRARSSMRIWTEK